MGIPWKELEEMSDENFQKNIQAGPGCANKNSLNINKPPSPSNSLTGHGEWENATLLAFLGAAVEELKMNWSGLFLLWEIPPLQDIKSKDNLFLQKLGPAIFFVK